MSVNSLPKETDTVVVGGGLTGLTAACFLAKAGRRVVLVEKSSSLGGKACTQEHEGFLLNLGAHALYQKSSAIRRFKQLGIKVEGHTPSIHGNYVTYEGKYYPLPFGLSAINNPLFSFGQSVRLMNVMLRIMFTNTKKIKCLCFESWLHQYVDDPLLKLMIKALARVSNYANDPKQQSAGATISQMKKAFLGNVCYLDGGWQSIVELLHEKAKSLGVYIRTHSRVQSLDYDQSFEGVNFIDGQVLRANEVVLAIPPEAVGKLCERSNLPKDFSFSKDSFIPVRAACLDLALSELPEPKMKFALGLEQPFYYSVHSAYADLTLEEGEVVHVMKYLSVNETKTAKEIESDLEVWLEQLQPGWRDKILYRRFLPNLIVSNALHQAEPADDLGLYSSRMEKVRGVYLAGDWIQSEVMLADAGVESAYLAVQAVLKDEKERALCHVRS